VDPARDESLIFELLDFKHEVGDDGSAVWFLQDLATEQEAEGSMVNFVLGLRSSILCGVWERWLVDSLIYNALIPRLSVFTKWRIF
jgi:hypothetical protein